MRIIFYCEIISIFLDVEMNLKSENNLHGISDVLTHWALEDVVAIFEMKLPNTYYGLR